MTNDKRSWSQLLNTRASQLERGYLVWCATDNECTIAAFKMDYPNHYAVMKFSHRRGIVWLVHTNTPLDAVKVCGIYKRSQRLKVSPRSAFWRNMPPELALFLNSRGAGEDLNHVRYFTTEEGEKTLP